MGNAQNNAHVKCLKYFLAHSRHSIKVSMNIWCLFGNDEGDKLATGNAMRSTEKPPSCEKHHELTEMQSEYLHTPQPLVVIKVTCCSVVDKIMVPQRCPRPNPRAYEYVPYRAKEALQMQLS